MRLLLGFTLPEIVIAAALFGLVVAGTLSVYIMCNKIWRATSVNMQAVRESSLALSRLVYGLETNSGLRAASTIALNTNVHGHPWPNGIKYWETGAKPPSAADTIHYLCWVPGYDDGSWRLIISNIFGGIKYVDYNAKVRNIVWWPDTNSMAQRLLVCNYVSAARVTTNSSGVVGIQLTVEKRDGMFISSNIVSTSIKMRNTP